MVERQDVQSIIKEQRSKCNWIFENGMWCCPFCHGVGEPNYLYCPSCGRVIEGVQVWLST